jgi:hypothetical protein
LVGREADEEAGGHARAASVGRATTADEDMERKKKKNLVAALLNPSPQLRHCHK